MSEAAIPRPSLERALGLYRRAPESRLFAPLAEAYRAAGQLEEAVRVLRGGLERHPRYASAHVLLALCLSELHADDEAEASFARVLELDPENLVALRYRAERARRRGSLDRAVELLRQVLEADPFDREVQADLGLLTTALERRSREERAAAERAQAAAFDGPQAAPNVWAPSPEPPPPPAWTLPDQAPAARTPPAPPQRGAQLPPPAAWAPFLESGSEGWTPPSEPGRPAWTPPSEPPGTAWAPPPEPIQPTWTPMPEAPAPAWPPMPEAAVPAWPPMPEAPAPAWPPMPETPAPAWPPPPAREPAAAAAWEPPAPMAGTPRAIPPVPPAADRRDEEPPPPTIDLRRVGQQAAPQDLPPPTPLFPSLLGGAEPETPPEDTTRQGPPSWRVTRQQDHIVVSPWEGPVRGPIRSVEDRLWSEQRSGRPPDPGPAPTPSRAEPVPPLQEPGPPAPGAAPGAPAPGPPAPAAEFATLTLARIYESQGYMQKALGIYDELHRKHPQDAEIAARLAALQRRLAGIDEPVAPPPPAATPEPPSEWRLLDAEALGAPRDTAERLQQMTREVREQDRGRRHTVVGTPPAIPALRARSPPPPPPASDADFVPPAPEASPNEDVSRGHPDFQRFLSYVRSLKP